MLGHHIESHTYIYILFVNSILMKLGKKYNLNLFIYFIFLQFKFKGQCCQQLGLCAVAMVNVRSLFFQGPLPPSRL